MQKQLKKLFNWCYGLIKKWFKTYTDFIYLDCIQNRHIFVIRKKFENL